MKPLILSAFLLAALAFLAGVDHGLDQRDQATKLDRMRVYCAMAGHSETLCSSYDAR